MQPTTVQDNGQAATDIATTIATTMRQMGVVGLPRNYEIFYEAMTGSNPELALEFVSLAKRPSQADLDRIGRRYFAQSHGQGIVENAREVIARELEEVASLLRSEQNQIRKYGSILGETSSGLDNRSALSRELLQKIVGVMATATSSTIEHGRQVAATLGEKTSELENVKSKLEEYKRLADTDPLTHIWNRRAFDKEIARVYDDKKSIAFSALILADIDRFKEINDRYGHPVGDRIIQKVAGIFRSGIRDDMFVARTGGEEFALIVTGSGEETMAQIADRIRIAIEQATFANPQTGVNYGRITISMGVCMASDADGADDLYAKADRALYASKIAGRNRVTKFSAIPDTRPGKSWLLYRKD
ncbi:GGDEF domain-containing protein [Mesorhizobium sp. L-8-10]|uniref:GGDEF domain-containing protein n=1 Tax=Mesorhizobium sp. L-8-10 TaxID=2744523 RepID=UPI001926AC59|nr:GGDEF domain-containing protein [Mesorhizobium sp. L-8-10]